VILETYRECLRDVFDLPGLRKVLEGVESRAVAVHVIDSNSPSPFAASLLFGYVGNFIYNGDAPLAERRAQTLALDHAQLRELLGDAEMRELLDADVVDATALELQRLDGRLAARDADEVHDLLQNLGDLEHDEIAERSTLDDEALEDVLDVLRKANRIVETSVAGTPRFIAAEDASRYRDALACTVPPELPEALLETVHNPLDDLVSRYARTHVPFRPDDVAARLGLGAALVRQSLGNLSQASRVIEGEFLPGGRGREWCDAGVLKIIKRRSLAKLRSEVEPVAVEALARFVPLWHGLDRHRLWSSTYCQPVCLSISRVTSMS